MTPDERTDGLAGEPMKKYELQPTDKTTPFGKPLFQVVALRDFVFVKKGYKGGYVESEANLSHEGNCWVYENAQVFGDAWVFGEARVYGNVWVFGSACVFGDARVYGDAWVSDNALVYGKARVFDNSRVFSNAQVFGDALVFDSACVFGDAEIYDTTERTNGLVGPAQTDTCDHKKRNICLCDWGNDCPMNSEPDFTYCPKCGEKL